MQHLFLFANSLSVDLNISNLNVCVEMKFARLIEQMRKKNNKKKFFYAE